jgi:replicative DNA helicase
MGKRADDIDILIQELSPDIIYLDGMYLVMPANAPRNTNRYERVGYVLDELKRMTIERDRPIVSTTQLNREAAGKKSKKAGLETLGYSDAIGTHSSVVLGMKMPDKVSLSRPNARFIEIFKGREGEAENFTINYSLTPVDFSECQLEDDTDSGATSRRGTAEIDLNWMA